MRRESTADLRKFLVNDFASLSLELSVVEFKDENLVNSRFTISILWISSIIRSKQWLHLRCRVLHYKQLIGLVLFMQLLGCCFAQRMHLKQFSVDVGEFDEGGDEGFDLRNIVYLERSVGQQETSAVYCNNS